ncbi:hypothetical protein LMIY3S_05080 [Labrys miyagiensis]
MFSRTTTRIALIVIIILAGWVFVSLGQEEFMILLAGSIICSAIPLTLAAIIGAVARYKSAFDKTFRAAALIVNILLSFSIIRALLSLHSDPEMKAVLASSVAGFLALLVTWDCVAAYQRKLDPSQPATEPSASATAAPAPIVNAQAQIEQLEKLSALKASGAIDDEEFARMKSQLMRRAGS